MTSLSADNLFSQLQKYYSENYVNVWVPSLSSFSKFKPISIDQQNKFIEWELKDNDNLQHSLDVSNYMLDVIKNNIIDVDYNKLNVYDKTFILFQLRYNISNEVKVIEDDKSEVVSLVTIFEKLSNTPYNFSDIETEDKDLHITIKYGIPTFEQENTWNILLFNLIKDVKDQEVILMEGIKVELFKYVKGVKINGINIELTTTESIDKNYLGIKGLPFTLLQKHVIPFIEKVKEQVDQTFVLQTTNGSKLLDVNIEFFTGI